MMRFLNRAVMFCLAAVITLGLAAAAAAADFPTKPVTLIVPYTAGGSADVTMRALAETTKKYLGQPVIIENRPGAGATIGPATMTATAKPDGYTVCQIPITVFRTPFMMKASWDPLKDFSYIVHVSGFTMGVVVKKDAPWKTFKEFIAYAKANPGKVKYATTGAASSSGITMETVALQQGIKWSQIPMKGVAETTAAILGGHVTATADSTGWASQVDSGDLRLLVTWGNGTHRTKKWPNVPTLKELGYGNGTDAPFGIAGPKGMDPKIVKILHDAFKKGMEDPAYQKMLDKYDMLVVYKNTADYEKYVRELCNEEQATVERLGLKKK